MALTYKKTYDAIDFRWWCFDGDPEGDRGPWDDDWTCPEGETWFLIGRAETKAYQKWIQAFLAEHEGTGGGRGKKGKLNPMEGKFKTRIREGYVRLLMAGVYAWDERTNEDGEKALWPVVLDPVRPERNTIDEDSFRKMMREQMFDKEDGDMFWTDAQKCAGKHESYLRDLLTDAEKKYARDFAGTSS